MASVIQSVLQKYKPTIEKQEKWTHISDEHKMASLRQERLAEAFMSLIVLSCCSEDRLTNLSAKAIEKHSNELLDLASQGRNVGIGQMKKIIGQFILDELSNNPSFRGLQE
jgi:hypothetical protein